MLFNNYRVRRKYNQIVNAFKNKTTLTLKDDKEVFKVIDLEESFLALYESGKLVEIVPIKSSGGRVSVIKVFYDPKTEDLKKGAENSKKKVFKNTNVEELKQLLNKIIKS